MVALLLVVASHTSDMTDEKMKVSVLQRKTGN